MSTISVDEAFLPDRNEAGRGPRYRFEVTRREFLGTLGAGLLVVAYGKVSGAEAAAGGADPVLARFHLADDGQVTVLTGKVEIGQGARTLVALATAEELRIPLARVRVLMADTAVVPDDGPTWGSMTTPTVIPPVRAAAAALRERIAQHLAGKWSVARDTILVREGVFTHEGQTASYADVAALPDIETILSTPSEGEAAITAPEAWTVLGHPALRLNAREIVTGAQRYPSDFRKEGMLYGKMLRPPAYGATLKRIDLNVRVPPGVVVVRDREFIGCAAPTSHEAAQAITALAKSAEWEVPEHPDHLALWDHLRNHARVKVDANYGRIQGSVEEGLKQADKVLEATYLAPYIQHVPMETQAALAEWEGESLTVHAGSQVPFLLRGELAKAFSMSEDKVRVVAVDAGGGFGGKQRGDGALEAARLAKGAGKPVLLHWTRAEEFQWAYYRPAAVIDIRAGLDASGNIAAWDFTNYNAGERAIEFPYRTPNSWLKFVPCDSPIPQGSYRALAATANHFSRECFVDELAHAAGRDPLEFRAAQLAEPRQRAVLEAAAEAFGWSARRAQPEPGIGIGLACGTAKDAYVAACVAVRMNAAGDSFEVLEVCEAFECGAILNPVNLRAQVQGCIIMGLGGALFEEALFEGGKILNASLNRYRVPRFKDVPKLDIVLLDRKDLPSCGAGETPIVAIAPAIGNALFHATGRRIRKLPLQLGA